MGPLVRLVGSGIGLASEAIAARKASKAEKEKAQAQGSSNTSDLPPSPSVTHSREPSPDPPAYSTLDPSSSDYGLVEAHDEDHARELVEKGHAVPHDQAHDGDHSDLEDDDDGLYVCRFLGNSLSYCHCLSFIRQYLYPWTTLKVQSTIENKG